MATKKNTAYKQKFNEKNYDRLAITVPKGQKATIQAAADDAGEVSINTPTKLYWLVWGSQSGRRRWRNRSAMKMLKEPNEVIRVLLIGVNHNDPLGRSKVHSTLRAAAELGFIPDIIGVEWNSECAAFVIGQREQFAKLIQEQYPKTNSSDIDTLKLSLAYEVDSHISLYPDIPILWLDEDRKIDRQSISDYATRRLKILISGRNNNSKVLRLSEISHHVIGLVQNELVKPSKRDAQFVQAVESCIKNGCVKIVCIVGSQHINHIVPGVFGYEIFHKGYKLYCCDTTQKQIQIQLMSPKG